MTPVMFYFKKQKTRLTLGDGVFIGRGSLIACNQEITIGTKTQIAHQVTIIDTDHKFNNTDHKFNNPNSPIAEQGAECSPIYIGENTWIGAASIVLRGVKIGKNSVIGAGTVVTKDVQAFSTSVGNPNKELSKRT
ncbi:MAG: acyltransferase [Deltaproteobacteria bacterium]|nr:acyltransferase [Deltaproteobacteria bacterium]